MKSSTCTRNGRDRDIVTLIGSMLREPPKVLNVPVPDDKLYWDGKIMR